MGRGNYGYWDYKRDKAINQGCGALVGALFLLVFNVFAYSPLLFAASYFINRITPVIANDDALWWLIFASITYLTYCIVFAVKGFAIALKVNRSSFWIPVFVVAVLSTCAVPAGLSYTMLVKLFTAEGEEVTRGVVGWSAVLSAVLGIMVYNKYKFHVDICPKLAFWAYSLGFRTALNLIPYPVDISPDLSEDLF